LFIKLQLEHLMKMVISLLKGINNESVLLIIFPFSIYHMASCSAHPKNH